MEPLTEEAGAVAVEGVQSVRDALGSRMQDVGAIRITWDVYGNNALAVAKEMPNVPNVGVLRAGRLGMSGLAVVVWLRVVLLRSPLASR